MSCAPHSGRHVSQRLILTSRARTSSARTRPRLSARGTAAAGRGTVCRSEMRLASSIEIMGQREPRAAPSALSHVCLSAIVHPVAPLVRGEKKVYTSTAEQVPTLHAALCSGGPVGAEGEGTSRSGTMDSKQRDKTVGPNSPNWKSSSDNVCSSPCVRSREPCAPHPPPTRRALRRIQHGLAATVYDYAQAACTRPRLAGGWGFPW